MVDANDAPGVKIPFLMMPSKDEPKEDVEKWEKAIKVKSEVKWWPNQIHGFMAARSDLKDSAVKKDYEAAYQTVLNWWVPFRSCCTDDSGLLTPNAKQVP